MKRLLFSFLLAMLLLPAAAENRDRAIIVASSDDKVQLETLSRIGYGFHFVKSPAFKPGAAGEFFFNFAQLDIFPTEFLEIQLGLDAEFNHFSSRSASFFLDDGRCVQVMDLPSYSKTGSKYRSGFRYFNINAPLMVKGIIQYLQVGVGVEASLNLAGKTFSDYREDNIRTNTTESGAKLNRFSFGLVAGLTYSDFGFFVKYYPKPSKVLAPGSVELSYWTLGITYGL